jgi:RES domain-containing protein
VRVPFSASAGGVALAPESGTWYRALPTHFLPTALSTRHTSTLPSRFSDTSSASPGFEILYLAENHFVALLEVQALLGSATTPGGLVSSPHSTWTTLNVKVSLQYIADLTDLASQGLLDVTAQELTGDWRGYRLRSPGTTVKGPTGSAPTQDLGSALFRVPKLEAFKTLSSKAPYHQILAIFPQKLQRRSRVSWFSPLTGREETIRAKSSS